MIKTPEAERQLGHTPLLVIYRQYHHHLRSQLPLLGYLLSSEVERATNYKHVIIEGLRQGPNGEIDGKKIGEVDCRVKMSGPYSFDAPEEKKFAFRSTSTSSDHPTGSNFFHTVRVQFQNGNPKLFFEMPVPRNRYLDSAIGFQPDPSSFLRFCVLPGLAPSWYVVSRNKWNDFDYPLDGNEDEIWLLPLHFSDRFHRS